MTEDEMVGWDHRFNGHELEQALRVGDAVQLSHPVLSSSPPALNFPSIRVFSNESDPRIRWPKFWSFSFGISPSNAY